MKRKEGVSMELTQIHLGERKKKTAYRKLSCKTSVYNKEAYPGGLIERERDAMAFSNAAHGGQES